MEHMVKLVYKRLREYTKKTKGSAALSQQEQEELQELSEDIVRMLAECLMAKPLGPGCR